MIKELMKESDGKLSFSRVLPIAATGLVLVLFLTTFIGIMFKAWVWTDFSGAMTWGKDFVFITVVPYLGNVGSKAVGKLGNNGVVTNDKVMSDEH